MYEGSLATASNRADYFGIVEAVDSDTGETLDISAATEFVMEVRDPIDCRRCLLSASLTDGKIALVTDSAAQWHFTSDDMKKLRPGTYDVDIVFTLNDIRVHLFSGTLAVIT